MATNGTTAETRTKTRVPQPRRSRLNASWLVVRLLIAFAISWLIILALFATSAISH